VSAGVVGLIQAVESYDPDRGHAFSTFAVLRIRGAILDELRRNCPLPQQILQRVARIRQACELLPPPVTPEALAAHTGLSTTEVEESLEAMRLTHFETWDESVAAVSRPAAGSDQPDCKVQLSETKQVLAECIAELPEKERLVITLYYLEDLRLKEIGKVLKLSESRISRILAKAEFRLKQSVRARGG
jgi:RNA polymerase sigma factor for flagellar operon FliA